jgi:hypothetical protein
MYDISHEIALPAFLTRGNLSVEPRGIEWTWTHNPAIYDRASLSKDLICRAGAGKAEWKAVFPKKDGDRNIKLRYVARLAPGFTCGVKNIKAGANGQFIDMPGEYLSIPHNNHVAYIYDVKTHMPRKELFITQNNPYWFLAEIKLGEPMKIEISCDPTQPGGKAALVVNLQYYQELRQNLLDLARKGFCSRKTPGGKERRFATAERGWHDERKLHGKLRENSMNSTSDVHPKGDSKSPLLGLPHSPELFAQGRAKISFRRP